MLSHLITIMTRLCKPNMYARVCTDDQQVCVFMNTIINLSATRMHSSDFQWVVRATTM